MKNYTEIKGVADLIATYEEVYNIPHEEQITEYFGDYSMHVFKYGVTNEQIEPIFEKALQAFGMDEESFIEARKTQFIYRQEMIDRMTQFKEHSEFKRPMKDYEITFIESNSNSNLTIYHANIITASSKYVALRWWRGKYPDTEVCDIIGANADILHKPSVPRHIATDEEAFKYGKLEKFVVIHAPQNDRNGDIFETYFDTLEEANRNAEVDWCGLTTDEQKRRHIYVGKLENTPSFYDETAFCEAEDYEIVERHKGRALTEDDLLENGKFDWNAPWNNLDISEGYFDSTQFELIESMKTDVENFENEVNDIKKTYNGLLDVHTSPDFQCDQTYGVPTSLCVCWEAEEAWLELTESMTVNMTDEELLKCKMRCAEFGIRDCKDYEDFNNLLKELGDEAFENGELVGGDEEEMEL